MDTDGSKGLKPLLTHFIEEADFEPELWRIYGDTPEEARAFFERQKQLAMEDLERFFKQVEA